MINIYKLTEFNGLKIIVNGPNSFIFEYDNFIPFTAHLCFEEAVEEAYLSFKSRELAKELIKKAKVTLE